MKYLRYFIGIILFTILFSLTLKAQDQKKDYQKSTPEWVKMMKDHTVNFYDLQKEFNEYFIDRPKGKGSGWKQFKRWEYHTEQRVYPSGKRINSTQVWDEMNKFNKKYSFKANKSNWTPLGPSTSANVTGHWNPGLGRINVIARDPNDSLTIYIGAPSGGLWKTTDEGATWNILTDNQPVMGVSAVAINPDNSNIVYIGTGDNDAVDNYSIGVLKSLDGGASWNTTGLNWTIYQQRTIAKILINPNNPEILFAATSDGLFRTTNSGLDWTNILSGNFDDIEFKPGDYNTIYAATTKFYRTTDGGDSFTETTGVPTSSRVQIAVTEGNPEYVYFFSSKNGIYRSTDSGDSFIKQSSQPNQGSQDWYDLAMDVSQTNPEMVHIGEINTWRSMDGGVSWEKTTDWTWANSIGYTHCDIHEIKTYGNTIFVGSDGLISKSTDNGETWTNLSEGLCIRQFYRIACSQTNPNIYMGGAQDNGTSVYTEDHWHEWLGADGMECAINQSDNQIIYGTSQNGTFYKSNSSGNYGDQNISQPGSGNWVTPFVIHPVDNETIFVGLQDVRKTTDGMQSWTTISDLPGQKINNIVISNSNPSYLYASKTSKIYRTRDGGEIWDDISSGLPGKSITYISVHPSNPEIIAVSLSGYTENEKVYISYDAGNTWINYSYNLPNIPANCVIFDDDFNNPLYVGMDVGVYYIDNLLSEWEPFMTNIPNVIINELEIQKSSKLLRAGTYGRGLWESPLHESILHADYTSDKVLIPIENSINFINLSSGKPLSYLWNFEGGIPETSTEKNPQNILYNNEGSFDVTLIVYDETSSDTIKKEDIVTVSSTLLPEIYFKASDTVFCSSAVVDFTDSTLYCPVTWLWEFSPNTVSFENGTNKNSENPSVSFATGVYSVSLTITNSVGESTLTKSDYVHSGGRSLPFSEDFETNSFNTKLWTIENPDNKTTWGIFNLEGESKNNKAAFLNFFNYIYQEQPDRMITPALNFSGYSNISLLFDHAYAQKGSARDSLRIKISADCGETWTRVFASGPDGNGAFATSANTTSYFIPQTSEDWCGSGYGSSCNDIDLSDWAGLTDVKIMFESFNKHGNNLFIDNIMVTNSVGLNENYSDKSGVNIIPNPSTGIFYLTLNNLSEETTLKVLNLQGQNVFYKKISVKSKKYTEKIDLSSQPKGVYFVEVRSKDTVKSEKIILK